MEIFTIGHSNYSLDKLINIIKKYNINCVVDIRDVPYSSYNIQYNKEDFQRELKKRGITYIYMGKQLGALREEKRCHTKDEYSDFDKVVEEESFKEAINRLKKGIEKGYKIVLLGAMQEPIRCTRSILLGRALEGEGFDVKHILHEGNLGDRKYIENLLLDKYFSDRNQLSIDNLLGDAINEEDMINKSYKYANEEIGKRLEKYR